MTLYRVGMGGKITADLSDCYHGMVPLKPAKVQDNKKLLEYVPVEKRRFYDEILLAATSLERQQENEDNDTETEIY